MQSLFSSFGIMRYASEGSLIWVKLLALWATDLDPPHEKQDDDHDQDDAEDADAAMAIAVAVAAEAATEPADEHDEEYDEEDKSERHSAFLSGIKFTATAKNLTCLSAGRGCGYNLQVSFQCDRLGKR